MERLFSILAGVAVLMIFISGLGTYWSSYSRLSEAREEAVVANAKTVALTLSKRVQVVGDILDGMAKDPDVIDAVASADKTVSRHVAERLEKYLPGAKKIRLIPVGVNEADTAEVPRMGFGDLDMVKATFLDNPPAAIQGDIGPDRHFAITRRIMQNNQAIGVILASMDFDFINQNLAEAATRDSYMEVRQAKFVLANNGKSSEGEENLSKENIPGTSWEVYFTDPESSNGGSVASLIGLILLPALLALGGFYLVYRQLSVLLAQDQDWLLKAFKDILTNQPKGSYPVSLDGMNAVVSAMVRFNREIENKGVDAVARDNDDFELEGYFDELNDSAKNIGDKIDEVDSSLNKPAMPTPQVPASKPALPKVAAPAQAEIPPVTQQPKAKAPSQLDTIFRAYDIRGVVGVTLNEQIVKEIGRAFGSEAKEQGCKTIVMGRDGRLSSPTLAKALANGIISTGCNVLDVGMVPTPVLYFVVQHSEGRTGAMLTGSHNPPEYNGLKLMIKGDTLYGERIQQLRKRIENQVFANADQPGTIEYNGMFASEYIGTVCDDIQINRSLKVVLDCGNGAAGEIAPDLLAELGCEVVPMYCKVDGTFPNHHPDPSKSENLADLIAAVAEHDADIGIAFDGDGDRLGVVDSNGKIIWPDRQMMLFAKDVLAGKPGSEIIYDVKCSRHLADQIIKYGGRPLMWKTGHSYMKAKLKETGAKLAGEMSGHIFFNDRWFGFDDALYSAARLLQVLSEDGRSSAEVFADFPDSINTPELNVQLAEGENSQFIERMFEKANFPDGKVTNIDGMRMDFSNGWGLVRASNTTPSLVIRFEADSQQALVRIQEQFRALMLSVKPDIKLPF